MTPGGDQPDWGVIRSLALFVLFAYGAGSGVGVWWLVIIGVALLFSINQDSDWWTGY